ncbi:MAG: extracellular solute-binding protein [Clostridia bacterium]|nr:extracellular solute-binding protein [Clostridia bacterium]
MKKKMLQRLLAFVLAVCFLFGGAMTVSASNEPGGGDDDDLQQFKEQLNAQTYEEYKAEHAGVPGATVDLPPIKGVDYVELGKGLTAEDVRKVLLEDGTVGLFTPNNGVVTWEVNIPSDAKYSIVIEYWPDDAKSASIERVLMIDGKIPFAEARFLSLPKVWKNTYVIAEVYATKDASVTEIYEAAVKAGFADADVRAKNGEAYVALTFPEVWTQSQAAFVNEYTVRFFTSDIDNNELRPSMDQAPELRSYELRDADGFYAESFEFAFTAGTHKISLEAVNEPITIKEIRLVKHISLPTYEQYLAQYKGMPSGQDKIVIQAEYPGATSSQTIYPVEDRTDAATMPADTGCTMLNTLGGEKWQTAGQWVRYSFAVSTSGMYNIAARYRQNVLDGMYTCRTLRIESSDGKYDGSVPFVEATRLRFNYNSAWQSTLFNSGNGVDYQFYFEKDVVYTITMEVALGSTGDIVRRVDAALTAINADYLAIMKLTGADPDELRDYGFARVMPDVMIDMKIQSQELYDIAKLLADITGEKSSNVATLEKVAWLLDRMGSNEDEIAKYLDQLKSYIGSLGTWLSDAKTQPLQLDYIIIQPTGGDAPQAKAGFFKALIHELSSFIMSFFRNYDRMGATAEETSGENTIDVWLAYGRDQAQVIRNLINNDFTPKYDVPVNLKLVAGGTLLPSVLAGMGPDVYIGIGEDDVINYAIRGALLPIENMPNFEQTVKENFNDAAMAVLQIEDAEGVKHCYGLPETQNFTMMFVRKDILADLDIKIPKTWDDVLAAIPTLQANNMQIGMHTDYKVFLYQMGGTLFADGGMRINLDSNVGLESFDKMCSFFTMYSFPYKYDFANRFRTGEMPIGFASYNGTYNQLTVFATEIKGLWAFYPMPGIDTGEVDENGDPIINNCSVATTSAIVMLNGCGAAGGEEGMMEKSRAWQFMVWHSGKDCQVVYSNEMVAIIGPSAKHATANIQALSEMPWTSEELKQLNAQFEKLASIPNYPGSYIIGRYTSFAFLAAYNDNADPTEELQSYITIINKEITRKREEFGLETLEIGQTLKSKRLDQLLAAWNADVEKVGSGGNVDKQAEYIMSDIIADIKRGDYDLVEEHTLTNVRDRLLALDTDAYKGTVQAINNAIAALNVKS